MKRIRKTVTAFLLTVASTVSASYGQHTTLVKLDSVLPGSVVNQLPKFQCKQAVYDSKSQLMTLTQDVSLKLKRLKLIKAGSVIYDLKNRSITVYDCKEFVFDGAVVVESNSATKGILRYRIDEDTMYVL